MRLLLAILALCLIYSCSSNGSRGDTDSNYKSKTLKRIYTDISGHEIEGYNHYLIIGNYDENSNNFLVDYADNYRDTCKTDLPVWSVTFCEPFNFKGHNDSEDFASLRQHFILRISYQEETLHKKFPDIGSVTFYKNGKPVYIQTMTLDRMKNSGYYDSNGAYNREWIKDFDKKYKTNFADRTK